MLEAFGWGLFAASSLLVGGLLVILLPIGPRLLGVVMAFGGGVLISATPFELVEEAFQTSGLLSDVVVLDGIPESAVIGFTLLEDGAVSVLGDADRSATVQVLSCGARAR